MESLRPALCIARPYLKKSLQALEQKGAHSWDNGPTPTVMASIHDFSSGPNAGALGIKFLICELFRGRAHI
jgi:hypothetical protein